MCHCSGSLGLFGTNCDGGGTKDSRWIEEPAHEPTLSHISLIWQIDLFEPHPLLVITAHDATKTQTSANTSGWHVWLETVNTNGFTKTQDVSWSQNQEKESQSLKTTLLKTVRGRKGFNRRKNRRGSVIAVEDKGGRAAGALEWMSSP